MSILKILSFLPENDKEGIMKNKNTKRSVSAVLVLVMLLMLLLPMSVPAATVNYRIKSLKAGKWANASYKYNYDTGIRYTYYKVSVAKPGRLSFSFSGDGSVYLYDTVSDMTKNTKKGSWIGVRYNSDSKMVAVEKGTYYLYVWTGKCRYTFTADPIPTNYCSAKAKKLKANATAYNVFTPRTNFTRWYKITTSSKKKISYWSNTSDNAYSIQIFNTKLRRLETEKNGSDLSYCTKAAQPKGTYYIRIQCQSRYSNEYDYAFGMVSTLKWK